MAGPFRLSICIPAYQGARFVATAIESALGQTEAPHEIVVSDNWSTDGTASMLERYRGRIRITRPPKHLCLSDHYWFLAESASGDYVVWLDADNALHPRFVEAVTPRMGHYAMIATGRFDCDGRLHPFGYSGLAYLRHMDCKPGELFRYFLDGCRHSHSGTAWARDWILALPRPPLAAEYVPDWYLGVVTAAHCSIAMLPAPRHYYRYHGSNASHSDPERWRRSAGAMLEWLASLDVLDADRRAQVELRLLRLLKDGGSPQEPPSRRSPARRMVRRAAGAVAYRLYPHPAYLR